MQGFLDFAVPLWVRRVVTMAPSLVVIALGVDVTHALVISQVVLSLVLPVPLIALLIFTRRRSVMGDLVNHPATTAIAGLSMAAILLLNVLFVLGSLGIRPPLIGS
jgi:manganese transport protein